MLDANILLRSIFGQRAVGLLESYEDEVRFCSTDRCFDEAQRNIPAIALKRGLDLEAALTTFERLKQIVELVGPAVYEQHELAARARIASRDATDWHVIAAAIALKCPIWTEDQDFFGCGVATWITATVEIYLAGDYASRQP